MNNKDCELIDIQNGLYLITGKCSNCGLTFKIELKHGNNGYCNHCDSFVVDGFDWEDYDGKDND